MKPLFERTAAFFVDFGKELFSLLRSNPTRVGSEAESEPAV